MDKNAIKKYATWARRELISRVSQKAAYYEITEEHPGKVGEDHIGGRVLTAVEKNQRDALIRRIQREGYEQTIEEVAYTWFNRFCALRYMEVNNYLPTHIRVFTDEEGAFKPQILTEAINLELDGLDMEKVYAYKDANKLEQLYRYLLITQCNALSSILPGMFQKIEDYTELLLPENLLREGSVIEQMVTCIPETDWNVNALDQNGKPQGQVQIIGWLYQYYNAEKKDEVFAALKKNVKITKENIPAATQLFTPDWIVRYMVENSLGRIWVEQELLAVSHEPLGEADRIAHEKQIAEQFGWKYYLPEAEQTPEVRAQLIANSQQLKADFRLEDLKVLDPCMGSGHILVYMFDVLMQIYESQGYDPRSAARSIVEHNLYGLDIDERSAQLAYFSVMMKARRYDSRFFSRGSAPKVYAIRESNNVDASALDYFVNGDPALKAAMNSIMEDMHDAKEYGSIIHVRAVDFAALYARFDEIADDIHISARYCLDELLPLVQTAEVLAGKYQVVCTNPPYMGGSNMSAKLSNYVKKNYPDSKSDLFAVFIERCGEMTSKNGYQAMITQHAWMFLSSYEKLRGKLLQKDTVNMAHLGPRAFEEIGGEVVQTTSFVLRNSHIVDYKGTYCRLIEPTTQQGKEDMFLAGNNRFISSQSGFRKTPGIQWAYWISFKVLSHFGSEQNYFETHAGITTGDNDYFLHLWAEIDANHIYRSKQPLTKNSVWYFHHKGGLYRKWYGNNELVLHYDAQSINEMRTRPGFRHDGKDFYFRESATWNKTGTGNICVRYSDNGNTFNTGGCCLFTKSPDILFYIMGLLNSNVMKIYLSFLCPTFSFAAGDVEKIPVIYDSNNAELIESKVIQNIDISRTDWDSFETSWDFKCHPLVEFRSEYVPMVDTKDRSKHRPGQLDLDHVNVWGVNTPRVHGDCTEKAAYLEKAYAQWEKYASGQFYKLKANEEELNRIFIDIYGLQAELTPEVEDKDVTVRLSDKTRDVKSLISYAVGCMFGRYSLDREGLVYAGGDFDAVYRKDRLSDESGNAITFGGVSLQTSRDCTQICVNGTWMDCTFPVDADNILPVCDDEYFEDDITGRFVKWVETVYGKATLQENLKFIADALGGKGQPKEVIRNYFLNDFYADHLKIYQKRPIYWLFDSGRKNGFKCLIYMHRYRPDTIARIRTDYVHEQQARYRTAIADLEHRVAGAATDQRVKLNKQLTKLQAQADELREYEEKIHHLADQMIAIDLDDGVKKNYAIFKDVLAKIM